MNQSIGVAALLVSAWMFAPRVDAQPDAAARPGAPLVIPPGQEALVAGMMAVPAALASRCRLDHASLDRTLVTAYYRCDAGASLVTIEARQRSDAPAAALHTEQFALLPGPGVPPELFSAVTQQVRADESRWRWVRLTPEREAAARARRPAPDTRAAWSRRVGLGVAVVAAAVGLRRLLRRTRQGPGAGDGKG